MRPWQHQLRHIQEHVTRDGLWVFAYGSLMWKPGFPVARSEPATLRGYHRKLCLYSHRHRGTQENPGLVFGLDHGGSCNGRALLVLHDDAESVLTYLFEREMITNAYDPRMAHVRLRCHRGQVCRALSFIIRRDHPQYAGNVDNERMYRLIHQGVGAGGTCLEYVLNTATHLREHGIRDRLLERTLRHLHPSAE